MMIYTIGDTHGEIDHAKLNTATVKKACDGVYPDYVIVLGDFGFIWDNNPDTPKEKYWLSWLEDKPWITLFIDGNHENHTRLNSLPNIGMFGSEVGQVSDKIFHLLRGHIYTIENKTFFCMGGAMSIDKEWRTPFVSWWPTEIPSYAEYKLGLDNLKKYDNKVDYVLTHTCPISIMREWFDDTDKYSDSTCIMLESYKESIEYKIWLFGHMHLDVKKDKFIASYNVGHII